MFTDEFRNILNKARDTPKEGKIPLHVEDEVMALYSFAYAFGIDICVGERGTVTGFTGVGNTPIRIEWHDYKTWNGLGLWGVFGPIGKLTPRKKQ